MMDFDHFAESYEDLLRTNLGAYGQDAAYYVEYKVLMMKRYAEHKDPCSVLDFGCGIGRSLPYLRRYFPESAIWGYDPSQDSLRIAQRNHPQCSFFSCDLDLSCRFDVVLASCVFHHISYVERDAVMARIKSVMNPAGELFIFEHNPYNPLTRHAVNTCPFDKDAELLTQREMARLVLRSGLTVVAKKYTLFFPSLLRRLSFLEPCLSALPFGGQYMIQAKYDADSGMKHKHQTVPGPRFTAGSSCVSSKL